MDDSIVWFTILTNNISSNPSPHMVVPFLLVPLNLQSQCQAMESKRGHTTNYQFQAQSKA